jgi:hypothetical protein
MLPQIWTACSIRAGKSVQGRFSNRAPQAAVRRCHRLADQRCATASPAIASMLMLAIVIALAVGGLSGTALRDVGVLGLATCLTGCKNQCLVMRL